MLIAWLKGAHHIQRAPGNLLPVNHAVIIYRLRVAGFAELIDETGCLSSGAYVYLGDQP
jgi:hypothetical protein